MVRGGSRDVVHECRRLGVLDRLYDMLLLTKVPSDEYRIPNLLLSFATGSPYSASPYCWPMIFTDIEQ